MIFEEKFDYVMQINHGFKSKIFVYFLIQDEEVVYVGQTTKGIIRPISHLNDKIFNSIRIMYCETKNLGKLEHEYILKYNPLYNKTKNIYNRNNTVKFISKNYSERLIEYRAKNKLKQIEMANELGVSRELINKLENKKIEPSKMLLMRMDLLEKEK